MGYQMDLINIIVFEFNLNRNLQPILSYYLHFLKKILTVSSTCFYLSQLYRTFSVAHKVCYLERILVLSEIYPLDFTFTLRSLLKGFTKESQSTFQYHNLRKRSLIRKSQFKEQFQSTERKIVFLYFPEKKSCKIV